MLPFLNYIEAEMLLGLYWKECFQFCFSIDLIFFPCEIFSLVFKRRRRIPINHQFNDLIPPPHFSFQFLSLLTFINLDSVKNRSRCFTAHLRLMQVKRLYHACLFSGPTYFDSCLECQLWLMIKQCVDIILGFIVGAASSCKAL